MLCYSFSVSCTSTIILLYYIHPRTVSARFVGGLYLLFFPMVVRVPRKYYLFVDQPFYKCCPKSILKKINAIYYSEFLYRRFAKQARPFFPSHNTIFKNPIFGIFKHTQGLYFPIVEIFHVTAVPHDSINFFFFFK